MLLYLGILFNENTVIRIREKLNPKYKKLKELEIKRNMAQCVNCKDVIESVHCHDFRSCSCYKNEVGNKGIAVDGGKEYLRRVGNVRDYIELSEYE